MKRSRLPWAAWLLPLLWGLPGGADAGGPGAPVAQAPGYPPAGYMHTIESSHVQLYWNCARPDAQTLRVEGVAVNPWSDQPVQFLGFDVAGVDARGHTVSSGRIDARGMVLRTNQSAPFKIDVRTTGSETRFDLYYQYLFEEHGDNPFFSMAAWNPAASRRDHPVLLAWTNQFMVRDACSPTQHLAH